MLDYNAVVKELVFRLDNPEHNGIIRRMVQQEILQLGSSTIPVLVNYLDSNNLWIVSAIAEILGELREKVVVPRLLQLLNSRELMILRKSVKALALIGDPSAIDPIIQLNTHESWHVKCCAADGLELFFTHPELHETLYHHFLDAVLQREVKEDFILTKIADAGWNIVQLKDDPVSEIQKILEKAKNLVLQDTDWYLLNYFQTIALFNCEFILDHYDSSNQPKQILEIYHTLLNQRKVAVSNNFNILI